MCAGDNVNERAIFARHRRITANGFDPPRDRLVCPRVTLEQAVGKSLDPTLFAGRVAALFSPLIKVIAARTTAASYRRLFSTYRSASLFPPPPPFFCFFLFFINKRGPIGGKFERYYRDILGEASQGNGNFNRGGWKLIRNEAVVASWSPANCCEFLTKVITSSCVARVNEHTRKRERERKEGRKR